MANANRYNGTPVRSCQIAEVMRRVNRVEQVTFGVNNRYGPEQAWITTELPAGSRPRGVASDGANIWVTNDVVAGDDSIQEFDSDINLQQTTTIGLNDKPFGVTVFGGEVYVAISSLDVVRVYDLVGALQRTIGSAGSGDGQFNSPNSIAGYNGEIYVVDSVNSRVQVFNIAGAFQRKWTIAGTAPLPHGIAVHIDGNAIPHVVVSDDLGKLTSHSITGTVEFTATFTGATNGGAVHSVGDDIIFQFVTKGSHLTSDLSAIPFSLITGTDPTVTAIGDLVNQAFSFGILGNFLYAISSGSDVHKFKLTGPISTWKKYGSCGTEEVIHSESGFDSVGPSDSAYHAPIPKDALAIGEVYSPLHVNVIRDVRKSLIRLAAGGNVTNIITGNPLDWTFAGNEDLYQNAVAGKETAIGRTSGDKFQWVRSIAEISASNRLYDVDIAELDLCSRFLARCAGVSDT